MMGLEDGGGSTEPPLFHRFPAQLRNTLNFYATLGFLEDASEGYSWRYPIQIQFRLAAKSLFYDMIKPEEDVEGISYTLEDHRRGIHSLIYRAANPSAILKYCNLFIEPGHGSMFNAYGQWLIEAFDWLSTIDLQKRGVERLVDFGPKEKPDGTVGGVVYLDPSPTVEHLPEAIAGTINTIHAVTQRIRLEEALYVNIIHRRSLEKMHGVLLPFEKISHELGTVNSSQLERDGLDIVFISHKWVARGVPDDGTLLDEVLTSSILASYDWFWIDYCCVPQHEHFPFPQKLKILANIPMMLRAMAMYRCSKASSAYATSFWCLAEHIMSERNLTLSKEISFVRDSRLTIFDVKEAKPLMAVLLKEILRRPLLIDSLFFDEERRWIIKSMCELCLRPSGEAQDMVILEYHRKVTNGFKEWVANPDITDEEFPNLFPKPMSEEMNSLAFNHATEEFYSANILDYTENPFGNTPGCHLPTIASASTNEWRRRFESPDNEDYYSYARRLLALASHTDLSEIQVDDVRVKVVKRDDLLYMGIQNVLVSQIFQIDLKANASKILCVLPVTEHDVLSTLCGNENLLMKLLRESPEEFIWFPEMFENAESSENTTIRKADLGKLKLHQRVLSVCRTVRFDPVVSQIGEKGIYYYMASADAGEDLPSFVQAFTLFKKSDDSDGMHNIAVHLVEGLPYRVLQNAESKPIFAYMAKLVVGNFQNMVDKKQVESQCDEILRGKV